MTTLGLADHHEGLRKVVRRFVDERVIPTAMDREARSDYPADLLPDLAAMGVLGMTVPEAYGGSAVDYVSYGLVFEELARGWMGLASLVGSSASGAWLIAEYGTDGQRERFLAGLAAGTRTSGIAMTEPSTGSDLKSIRVGAVRRGDEYIVNGTKTMITHARHASPMVVLVRTDPSREPVYRGGMSLLLLELDTPGYTIGRDIGKLGHKGVELCELAFDDARVPASNLLGGIEGEGYYQMMSALDRGRIYMAGAAIGIARASLEAATRYAKDREAFGRRIGDFQAIKLKLAKMATNIAAARLLMIDAATATERDGRASVQCSMAKVFAAETAIEASLEAMRIHGGYGYTTEFPVERFYRDVPLMAIGEGMNDILMLMIADSLLASSPGS